MRRNKTPLLTMVLIIMNSFLQVKTSGPFCKEKSETFTYVKDSIARPLCAVETGTSISPVNQGSLQDCLNFCWLNTTNCMACSYYGTTQYCEAYNYVPRNYARVSGCRTFRVIFCDLLYDYLILQLKI